MKLIRIWNEYGNIKIQKHEFFDPYTDLFLEQHFVEQLFPLFFSLVKLFVKLFVVVSFLLTVKSRWKFQFLKGIGDGWLLCRRFTSTQSLIQMMLKSREHSVLHHLNGPLNERLSRGGEPHVSARVKNMGSQLDSHRHDKKWKVSVRRCKTECSLLFNSICIIESLLPSYSYRPNHKLQ